MEVILWDYMKGYYTLQNMKMDLLDYRTEDNQYK